MAEKFEVDLERNSSYRVTLELALIVARAEKKDFGVAGTPGDRKYWLDLYARCRNVVVDGWAAAEALKGS